ncbi:MAG TPA: hypothetical protein VIJ20_09950 [Solirubrobacteraceae bacterium]
MLVLAAAVVVSPAWAAFPGRDGLLAVQPVSGRGIVPDGRALTFQASTVHLIYPDGSCRRVRGITVDWQPVPR